MKGKVKKMIPGARYAIGEEIEATPWLISGGYITISPEQEKKMATQEKKAEPAK